jgi:hypothetical protein
MALTAVALAVLAEPARAGTVTFASFTELDSPGNTNQIRFTNNGQSGSSAAGTLSTTSPGGALVQFNYQQAGIVGSLPADLTGNQATHMFVSLTTVTPATSSGGVDVQPLLVGTVQFLRDSTAGEGTEAKRDLLTVVFNASLVGLGTGRSVA